MFEKRKDNPEPEISSQNLSNPNAASSRSSAVIGASIKINGTVTGDENLIVEGTIEGNVDLPKNDLTVGATGKVTADITANTVRVDGQVTGDIAGTEKVIISRSGKVLGNIKAPRVTLEDGAKFKGSIDMDPGDNERSSKPAAAATNDTSAAKQAG